MNQKIWGKEPENMIAAARKVTVLLASLVLVAAGVLLSAGGTAMAQPAGTTIQVGNLPWGIAANSMTNRIYVVNEGSPGAVSVIDGSAGSVVGEPIVVGRDATEICVNPKTDMVYVINSLDDTVSVIDGATNEVTKTIPVDTNPVDICVNPDTNKIYVGCYSNATMVVIDGATNKVKGSPIALDFRPDGVCVNPTTNLVYAAGDAPTGGMVDVIDGSTDSVATSFEIDENPANMGVNPQTNRIYVPCFTSNYRLNVINGADNKTVAKVEVGNQAGNVDVDPATNMVYVSNYGDNNVSVVNGATNEVAGTAKVGFQPQGVSVDSTRGKIYVANSGNGTVSVIQDALTSSFYFAEGYTGEGFREYLCIGNAGPTDAIAEVTYMFNDGSTQKERYTVRGVSRTTVNVNSAVGAGKEVSIKLTSDSPDVVAERPLYFEYEGSSMPGGSDVIGARTPARNWYFAEGTTIAGFLEYITVLNPGNTEAYINFRYMVEGEGEEVHTGTVGATSRKTFKAIDHVGEGKNISLLIESNQDVVAERPIYFDYQGLANRGWTGGECVMGISSPATLWYFAEGTTRDNAADGAFEEWLTIQNPNSDAITVEATYQFAEGQGDPVQLNYQILGNERKTVSVNQEVGPDKDVSIILESDSHFVAERPIYFNYRGWASGGSDVMGANSPSATWSFAEGYTGPQFQEWLTILNIDDFEHTVTITYQPQGEDSITKFHNIDPNSRYTVDVNTDAGSDMMLSAQVTSDGPIIVERPMYFIFNGTWPGGHDVVGH